MHDDRPLTGRQGLQAVLYAAVQAAQEVNLPLVGVHYGLCKLGTGHCWLVEQEAVGGSVQCNGNVNEDFEAQLSKAGLNVAHVGWRDVHLFRELFLRETL